MRPDGADLLDEDPITSAFAGLFETYGLEFAGFDDQGYAVAEDSLVWDMVALEGRGVLSECMIHDEFRGPNPTITM